MRTEHKFGTSVKAIVAGIALVSGLLASAIPAGAATTAPELSTMDRTIIGSGSDTTYDLMMTLDKVYAAANGCATIWASSSSQPKNGQCDTADTASGNGPDKSAFPWVNDSHATAKELYPVGSGAGQTELCNQSSTNVRAVDFARSSSGPATSTTAEKCSDLKYVAYAEDAVTWYHFTKNPNGTDTASSRIVSIDKATLTTIFRGEVTLWSQLNGNSGVLDVNGNPFAAVESSATPSPAASTSASPLASPLPSTGIVLYTTQSNSGTYSYWTNASRTNSTTKMSAPSPTPVASQTAPAIYTTNQENYPAAIKQDGNTNNAIYFMSVGRYKQLAGITDQESAYSSLTASGTHNAGGLEDALGQVNGVEPTIANIAKGADKTTGYFPYSRNVYNITRYASASTNAYVGPDGFLCKITDSTTDRIKISGYRTLIQNAIKSEGFAPLPVKDGSYCRVDTANVAVTPNDATAPTITLAAPSPSANASGAATFTISFNEPVRATDASKLTVAQTGNSSIAFTTTATNSKGVTVSAFDSGNTNDLDPYANKVVSTLVVNVTGIAYDADGSKPVTVSLAAAAVKDRAGNSSALATFTTASRTTAPDLASPSASAAASSNASGVATFTVNFSRGVRLSDASKLTASQSGNSTLVVAYSAANANGAPVSLFDANNTNANDPNGVRLVKTATVTVSGVAYGSPVSINFAAGAGTATNATTTPELNYSVDSNTTAPAPADTASPSASASASSNASGVATFTVNFSRGVRLTEASALTASQSGNSTLVVAYSAKNAAGSSVALFDANNTNADDPNNVRLVKTAVVTVSGVAYGSPVSIKFAAGAGTATNATTTPELNYSVDSNTTAPVVVVLDTEAPTVSALADSTYASGTTAAPGTFKLSFSEPVRNVDLSKFSYITNANAAKPAAIATPAAVYTCKTASGRTVVCDSDSNNNDDNPSASLAVKTMDIKLGKTSVTNASLVIAADAFSDKAGNSSASAVLKKALADVADTGVWTTDTNTTGTGTHTVHVWGSNKVTVEFATGTNGGLTAVTVDGVGYNSGETAATVGTAGAVNLYTTSTGSTTVEVAFTSLGWHTVKIDAKAPVTTANATGLPSKRLLTAYVAAVPAIGTVGKPGYVAGKAEVKATFAQGKTVKINSISAS